MSMKIQTKLVHMEKNSMASANGPV